MSNHAGRWFGTLRAGVSRLVRRTYSFSRCIERHLEAIHLFIPTYNLSIQQATTTQTLPRISQRLSSSLKRAFQPSSSTTSNRIFLLCITGTNSLHLVCVA